jgi:hypothetical protein
MWEFLVTIINVSGHRLEADVKVSKKSQPTEIEARRAIIHDCMAAGGHVTRIEIVEVQY